MLSKLNTANGVGLTALETMGGSIPIWQNPEDLQKDQGGFTIANPPAALAIIPAGTPVNIDESARTLGVGYRFEVYEEVADDAVIIKVVKYSTKYGALAKVGMHLMAMPAALATAGAAYTITAIDTTTSALYDAITIGTTLGATLAVGSVVAEADSTHATTAVLKYAGERLTYDDVFISSDALQYNVSTVYFGSVYARRIREIAAIERAAMPQINFSESK